MSKPQTAEEWLGMPTSWHYQRAAELATLDRLGDTRADHAYQQQLITNHLLWAQAKTMGLVG